MLKKLALAVAVLVVAFLAFASTRPDHFTLTRSAVIRATPAVVYGMIDDFHQWGAWSPWARLDPSQKITFAGAPVGKGAIYEWAGNDKVGQGRMEIVGDKAGASVDIQIEFIKPFPAKNDIRFELSPSGTSATLVAWTMNGKNTFMGKVMSVFIDMEKMVGPDFERGLAQMKTEAEADQKKRDDDARAVAEAQRKAAEAAAAAAAVALDGGAPAAAAPAQPAAR
jgi:hypothetical protein